MPRNPYQTQYIICVLVDGSSDGGSAGEQRPHPEEEAPGVPERAAHLRREQTDPGEHQTLHRRAGGARKVDFRHIYGCFLNSKKLIKNYIG